MRRAFSLIELLVVMTVIGLLMAMLMPLTAMVMVKADEVVCLNNLSQLARANLVKAHDWNGKSWFDGFVRSNVSRTYSFPAGNLTLSYAKPDGLKWTENDTDFAWFKFTAFTAMKELVEDGVGWNTFRCPADPYDFGVSWEYQSWWADSATKEIVQSQNGFYNSYYFWMKAFRLDNGQDISFRGGNLERRFMIVHELGPRNYASPHIRGTANYSVGGSNAAGIAAFLDGRAYRFPWEKMPATTMSHGTLEYCHYYEAGATPSPALVYNDSVRPYPDDVVP